MHRLIIVSKTKYSNLACVGALDLDEATSYRLMSTDGTYPEKDEFNIGQKWQMELQKPQSVTPPHVEDIYMLDRKYIGQDNDPRVTILSLCEPWAGSMKELFGGCLEWTSGGKGYIAKGGDLPDRSTWFWFPQKGLERIAMDGAFFFHEWSIYCSAKWIGLEEPPTSIRSGDLVRVSLARWWCPRDRPDWGDRCFLQISGVF